MPKYNVKRYIIVDRTGENEDHPLSVGSTEHFKDGTFVASMMNAEFFKTRHAAEHYKNGIVDFYQPHRNSEVVAVKISIEILD